MAALGGHGKLILGVMSYQGIGVPKDMVQADGWFALAQSTLPAGIDHERSIKAIRLIQGSLSPEQLSMIRGAVSMAITGAD